MYVHVEVLDTRGSLAGLGANSRDQIVLRVGLPPSPRSKKPTPERIVRSPILNRPTGIALPAELVSDLKREITKRPDKRRALDKYLARLQVTKGGKWVGTVYVRLVCLANGFIVERWVIMKPAGGVEPGALQLRLVMRETEEAALAVLSQQPLQTVEPNDLSRTKGCECDVCDPYGELNDEDAKRIKLAKEGRAALTILAVVLDKYLVELLVTKHAQWITTVSMQPARPVYGNIVQRWFDKKYAPGVAGALLVRFVRRELMLAN